MFSFKTLATIVLPSLVAASCMHGTSHMKRQLTSSNTVAISNFGYSGLQGPLNWAGLSLANSACATSAVQSPINIDSTIGLAEVKPVFEAPDVEEAEIENLGTTVEVVMEGLGAKTTVGDVEFEVKQFHFHTPSEHRIAEEYSVMEMHIVHEGPNGELAVIAVPFDFVDDGSSTTSLLTSVFENLADVTVPGSVSKTGALSFSEVVSHLESSDIFQYTGSLTTPPCAEGLTFFVAKEPMPIDVQTFSAVKKVIKFNARFTQNTLGNFNLLTVASSVDKFLVQNPVAAVAKKEGDEIVVDKEENVEGEGEVVEDNKEVVNEEEKEVVEEPEENTEENKEGAAEGEDGAAEGEAEKEGEAEGEAEKEGEAEGEAEGEGDAEGEAENSEESDSAAEGAAEGEGAVEGEGEVAGEGEASSDQSNAIVNLGAIPKTEAPVIPTEGERRKRSMEELVKHIGGKRMHRAVRRRA